MRVHFLDTTILCNLVPVPGRDDQRRHVLEELRGFIDQNDVLILPITAVVETGNFVAQLPGEQRRAAASSLASLLRLAVEGRAPFVFHDFGWDRTFVARFLAGGDTGQEFVELATAGLGSGDALILTEIATYRQRSRLPVHLWTHDRQLGSYG